MSIDTRTNPTSTVRQDRPAFGAHSVAVAFSVCGAQPTSVPARDGGGLEDKPYVAVAVGECLTYGYGRQALFSHVQAWRGAGAERSRPSRTVRRRHGVRVGGSRARRSGPDGSTADSVVHTRCPCAQAAVSSAGRPYRPEG